MTTVKFNIPLEPLIEAITSLDLEKKHQLLEILEGQFFEAEEDSIEQEPQVIDEIEDARSAYQRKDYQTIQEYIAGQSGES
jgi:hypothetical protein